jgi:hypothetical protein
MIRPYKKKFLLNEIIIPVLQDLALYSKNDHRSEAILMGTVAVESDFGSLRRQIGINDDVTGGFGICQIELATDKLVENWLTKTRPYLFERIKKLYLDSKATRSSQLMYNDKYSIAIARCLYLSINEPLPSESDIKGLANYWKQYYNRGGKGTVDKFIENYNKYVL